MVITPKQAKELSQEELEQLASLEGRIDLKLSGCFYGNSVLCSMPEGTTEKIMDKIQGIYEDAGWHILRQYNENKEYFLRFSLPKKLGR